MKKMKKLLICMALSSMAIADESTMFQSEDSFIEGDTLSVNYTAEPIPEHTLLPPVYLKATGQKIYSAVGKEIKLNGIHHVCFSNHSVKPIKGHYRFIVKGMNKSSVIDNTVTIGHNSVVCAVINNYFAYKPSVAGLYIYSVISIADMSSKHIAVSAKGELKVS